MNLDWGTFWWIVRDETARMWWIFVLGVLLAAAIKTFKLDKRIRKRLAGRTHGAILFAVGVALVSPLCSCGVIPLIVSLIYGGVPLAPVFALLITSPLMSPDAFLLTLRGLGPALAFGKLASAVAAGLAGGYLVVWMQRAGWIRGEGLLSAERPDIREKCMEGAAPDDPRRGLQVPERRLWYFGLMVKDMAWIIGRFFVPAILLEAAIVAFVPIAWMRALAGAQGVGSVLVATLAGIPVPLPQVAAVPVIRGLMTQGMNAGAAMALLVSGPVASIPAFAVLTGIFQRPVLALYVATGFVTAVLAGLTLLALG
ncbi:MAG TPA: permease [bacterium]